MIIFNIYSKMISVYIFVHFVAVVFGYTLSNEQFMKIVTSNDYQVAEPPRFARQAAAYICVPVGTCIKNSTLTIDPRIVTPGLPVCRPGEEACYGSTTNAQCGQRYVPTISTADGPSTFGAYPWQAFILNQTTYTGSGVLIDEFHVLTAAHKVNPNCNTPERLTVYMGVHNPSTSLNTAQMRLVEKVVQHPQFDPVTLKNDIAILRLKTKINLGFQTNVATACLVGEAAAESFVGQRCTVTGWGKTGFTTNDAPTSPQKQVTVPIVSMATCAASMARADVLGPNVDKFLDKVGEICAGGEANKDACTQDGGSPLICFNPATQRHTVVGLVIWGVGCGRQNVYGAYVKVPYYKERWIDPVVAGFKSGLTQPSNCK